MLRIHWICWTSRFSAVQLLRLTSSTLRSTHAPTNYMASFFIKADEKGSLELAGTLEKITSESPNLGSKIRHPTQSREWIFPANSEIRSLAHGIFPANSERRVSGWASSWPGWATSWCIISESQPTLKCYLKKNLPFVHKPLRGVRWIDKLPLQSF